jgi:hypothetical protein
MVSWDHEDTVIERSGADGIEHSQFSTEARNLFLLGKQGNAWVDLAQKLQSCSVEVIINARDETNAEGASLLHVVLSRSNVPLSLIESILALAGGPPSIATLKNNMQQIPLHTAIHCIPERTEIVKCLVQAAPESIRQRDYLYIRPIDILCQKVIMMEEIAKYSHQNDEDVIEKLWDTAYVLAHASCWASNSEESETHSIDRQPIVHSCLRSFDFPFALKERAMDRYESQLRQPDSNGDLPLHIIARLPPRGEDNEDDELDFFHRVLSLYPKAALSVNKQQQTPFSVAVQSGRTWNSGLSRLLEENPAAIDGLQIPINLYPIILARLRFRAIYGMVTAKPDMFFRK